MNQKEILGTLMVVCLSAILFCAPGSKAIGFYLMLGIFFGVLWFFRK